MADRSGLFAQAIGHHQAGRLEEAIAGYRQVLALNPGRTEALNNMGAALADLKQWDQAVEAYRRVIDLNSKVPEVHYNLAIALRELGRTDEAVAAYRRAIALKPGYAEAHNNLGAALADLKQWDEAVACYQRALRANPALPQAYNNLGNALREQGDLEKAIAAYQRALACDPGYVDAYINAGTALGQLNDWPRAAAVYRRARELGPNRADAHYNLGIALRQMGRPGEAIPAFRAALALEPDNPVANAELTYAETLACEWRDATEWAPRLLSAANRAEAQIPSFFILTQDVTLADQLFFARQWTESLAVRPVSRPAHRTASGKIRLGYLSADLRDDVVGLLLPELIERHDRAQFEVVAYCYGADDGSAARQRLRAGFDRFVELRGLSTAEQADRIAADEVDILVDVMGYTQQGRGEIVARRPAPIQVNYLGYPGTMGADFIDYIIVDPWIAPSEDQPFYAERLVQLPECYLPSDTRRVIAPAPSREECGLSNDGFVFCCFNSPYKFAPRCFDAWMRLLRDVPDSVLWLVRSYSPVDENLRREAAARGIEPSRLVFSDRVRLPDYLARLQVADLFLDTVPYNAGATANDALWAGLPLLTCSGKTYVSRMAGSQLRAAGVPELIANSLEQYEALALQLAREPSRLAALRAKLRENRATTSLFDMARYTRHLEAAYHGMWDIRRRGDAPKAFQVNALGGPSGDE